MLRPHRRRLACSRAGRHIRAMDRTRSNRSATGFRATFRPGGGPGAGRFSRRRGEKAAFVGLANCAANVPIPRKSFPGCSWSSDARMCRWLRRRQVRRGPLPLFDPGGALQPFEHRMPIARRHRVSPPRERTTHPARRLDRPRASEFDWERAAFRREMTSRWFVFDNSEYIEIMYPLNFNERFESTSRTAVLFRHFSRFPTGEIEAANSNESR